MYHAVLMRLRLTTRTSRRRPGRRRSRRGGRRERARECLVEGRRAHPHPDRHEVIRVREEVLPFPHFVVGEIEVEDERRSHYQMHREEEPERLPVALVV